MGIVQLPLHLHIAAQARELGTQRFITYLGVFRREMHAHEEKLRLSVAKLGGIDNIAAMLCQKAGNLMNYASLIRARQGEYVFWMHNDKEGALEFLF
ncbi:hypothetical protein GCM10011396_01890 [Undibacterium terreum]|uniref:Uncharacterized protein n=1 Tax=Undibacterium terreum TaxID=1224302 RepID=A0A916U393_9BURK|nr:hypothetical protein GCM10011396_01890 [Undibacterium terreum]